MGTDNLQNESSIPSHPAENKLLRNLLLLEIQRRSEYVRHSDIATRLLRGTFWSFIGAAASRTLTLIGFVVAARILGKEQFGKLGVIQVTVAMFQIFAGFGLGLTATKYVSEYRRSDPARAGRIVALSVSVAFLFGTLASAALLAFAGPVAIHTLGSSDLVPLLRISAVLLFFSALNGFQSGTMAGLESFRALAGINLMVGVIGFVVMIAGCYFDGLRGAITALTLTSIVNWAVTQYRLRSELARAQIKLEFRHCAKELRILRAFSIPAILCGAMVVPVNWLCSALLVRGSGYSQMGIFTAMNQWFSALLFLPTVLEQVTLPLISERLGAKDHQQSRKVLVASIKINFLIVAPLIAVAFVFSPLIVRSYGPEFNDSTPVLLIVLVTAGLYAIQAPVGQLVAAADRMWLAFVMNLGWAITMLICTELLIHRGALGLASARMIAYCVHCLWTLGFAYRFASQTQKLHPATVLAANE